MKKLILFFSLLIVNYSLSIAEVRYVSHSGSNSPPYLTWETAADSIMSAINISSFGDTIYVANGVYEEQLDMIAGLSLIGSGMDSCIIDTRGITIPDWSVQMRNHCALMGFNIIHSNNNLPHGNAIFLQVSDSTKIMENKIESASIGINHFWGNYFIEKNIFKNVSYGFYSDDYFPSPPYSELIISNNIITAMKDCLFLYAPIYSRILIKNNILSANKDYSRGIEEYGITIDTVKIYNNLILINNSSGIGITTTSYNDYIITNNYISGHPGIGISARRSVFKNNVVTNCSTGIATNNYPSTIPYNNLWENLSNYDFGNADSSNLSVDPMVVNEDTTNGGPDFHLQAFSPLIDRGDPNILDKDSTRSDIGLYGGPFGESYKYQDLPPRAPVNLSAIVDTDYIQLKWNKNTEADFSHYNLYRDTTENFTADSTTFVASIEDTFYLHIRPEGINNLYFKLTAEDNQGNVSEPSEELHLVLTGTINNEQFIINNYKLFQNYPNPFNPSTRIGYRLKERGYVKLYVYDIKGELVETLVNQQQEAGYHEVEFRGEVRRQETEVSSLASGIYIYQIMVQNENNIPVFTDMNKMIYLK